MSRSLKLQLTPLWPALAAVVVATALLWSLVPRLVATSSAEQLLDTLDLLDPVIAARLGEGTDGLQGWIDDLAGENLRITIIASDGVVLADSARTAEQLRLMDNHAGRPEVTEALATGGGSSVRLSATLGIQYAYAAHAVTAPDGRLYVVRLAKPLAELRTVRRRLTWTMAWSTLAGLAVLGLVSLWLSRRLFRPLARLIEGAGELASGRYSHRLEPPEDPHLGALATALNRLARRVEEQIEAVRAERDHLGAIVRSMSDGVLVTDARGRALLTNPAFRELFGLTEDPVGKRPLEVIRQPELARIVEATLEEGAGQSGEIEVRSPERRTVALTSAALTGAAGSAPGGRREVEGAVVVAQDTTQFTRVNEIRRDFVANVSHELKTPLAAIRGYAETLRDGALEEPPIARRFVGRLIDQCRRLQVLLDDLLVLSRLETPEEEPRREEVELYSIVRRAVETVQELAAARGVDIRVEGPPLPTLEGDPESLERMVLNLLDNAVKYNSPEGEVIVRLARSGEGTDRDDPAARGPAVSFEVEDTGIGIPKDAVDRIFERFYRVDKGRSREEGGTGLGLAIVKHIAQLHGGTVEVESQPGVGSTFRVVLPLRAAARRREVG